MVKDSPNQIPMHTIVSAQTLHEIPEDDVPILTVVLITPKDLQHSASLWDHIIHLLGGG